MVTIVVYAVLALVVVSALVALAVLVLPSTEQLAPAPPDRAPWALPAERAMTGDDVGKVRLPVTLRGYRFAETDAVLDRLGEEIAYRDSVIATLRAELENDVYGPAVELGETPEESEAAEVLDAPPAVLEEAAELEEVEVDEVVVVAIDDDLLDVDPPGEERRS